MAKALGERTKMMLHPTGMWEVIRMTKRKVMESSFGHLATNYKGNYRNDEGGLRRDALYR